MGKLLAPLLEGELRSALIANEQTDGMFEVFAHPITGTELVAQGEDGVLRVNGLSATAKIVDYLGNGDVIVRIWT